MEFGRRFDGFGGGSCDFETKCLILEVKCSVLRDFLTTFERKAAPTKFMDWPIKLERRLWWIWWMEVADLRPNVRFWRLKVQF
jgi:hypothetical protein